MRPKAEKDKPAEPTGRDQGRVLVITDSSENDYREQLQSAGFNVVAAPAGASSLVTFHRTRPHLVVADTATRGLSIPELGRLLSNTKDGVPLILVGSGPSTFEMRVEALLIGAFDYIRLPDEMELLVLRAGQLVQIQQTMDQLREEADFDQLTGLANRRRFRVALTREVERWRRYGVPCSLLLIDIDFMKAINDEHGHPFGDLVIRSVAKTLASVSRDNDTAARLGGEEFALLFAGIGAERARLATNRLLGLLREQEIEGRKVTVSIGLAACPAHANSERMLYAASDRALYVAKNNGRNQVAVAELLQENLPGV